MENMLLNDCIDTTTSEQMLKIWSWKTRKSHGKGPEEVMKF